MTDIQDPEATRAQLEIALKERPSDRDLRDLAAQVGESKGRVDAAQQRLAEAQREHDFWQQLAAHRSADRSASILLLLRESGDLLHRFSQAKNPRLPLIERIQQSADDSARANTRSFGRAFPERVNSSDFGKTFPIDSTSRHPTYTFAQGFLTVEVDERNNTAVIAPRDGERMLVGLDLDYVVDRIGFTLRRLFDRTFDRDNLVKSIYTAYVAVLRSEDRPDGNEVPLRRVSNRMAKNMNRFSADEFNVDLARLVKQGRVEAEGRVLHLNHTRNARQGMLLFGMEEGGYVGFVSFKQD